MITRVTIKNFKKLENVSIDLDDHVVFVGPNNSGKTTALQALAVWRLALSKWLEKRDKARSKAKLRTGVAISRSDLIALPVRDMKLIWHNCEVLGLENKKMRAEIVVEGETGGAIWIFGMELEYAGPEQIYCRPMRKEPESDERMEVPAGARELTIVHLPPLAGLQRLEERANERTVRTRISEGRAGDILRNLLLSVSEKSPSNWDELNIHVAALFQVELLKPQFLSTGEILVEYYDGLSSRNRGHNPNTKLELSMGGSGFHQVLLLLAFLYDQAGAVLLFDEPDAHLEIIRQRDVYSLLRRLAKERGAQIIVSTHSEEIMDNTFHANIRAFLGDAPRPLASPQEAAQLRKALVKIPSSDYLKARERRGVLYVEDYTDLDVLREWAGVLKHPSLKFLKSPFSVYVGNVPSRAREHFYGLHSAHRSLKGVLLLDHIDTEVQTGVLKETMWKRREIENYLLVPEVILRFCEQEIRSTFEDLSLFAKQIPELVKKAETLLRKRILEEDYERPFDDSPFLADTKASDVILEPFFKDFFRLIKKYNTMPKSSFYRLAAAMKESEIHPEVKEKLDYISTLAQQ